MANSSVNASLRKKLVNFILLREIYKKICCFQNFTPGFQDFLIKILNKEMNEIVFLTLSLDIYPIPMTIFQKLMTIY